MNTGKKSDQDGEKRVDPEATATEGDHGSTSSNHDSNNTSRGDCLWGKRRTFLAILAVIVVAAVIVAVLAIFLPDDSSGPSQVEGSWKEVFGYFDENIDVDTDPKQAYFSNTGNRLFVTRAEGSVVDASYVQIYDYVSENETWVFKSNVDFEPPIDRNFHMAVNGIGDRIVVSAGWPSIIMVFDEEPDGTNWTQHNVNPADFVDSAEEGASRPFSSIQAFSLSLDGLLMTIWGGQEDGAMKLSGSVQGTWKLEDHTRRLPIKPVDGSASDVGELYSDAYISGDGDNLFLRFRGDSESEYAGRDLVNAYRHNHEEDNWTLLDSFVQPEPQDFDSSYGESAVAFGYFGNVVAVGALNFEHPDDRWGLVEVYEADADGRGYQQTERKGATFRPSSGEFRFGEHVAINDDGDHLAISYERGVYVYRYVDGEWLQLGNIISNSDKAVKTDGGRISLSSDGSRLGVPWSCSGGEGNCISVYEFIQSR